MNKYTSQQADYIHDGLINRAMSAWHSNRPERVQTCATPSTMTDCPRVVWLRYKKQVPPPIPLGWGKLQRLLQGRVFEDVIAKQLEESGHLLYHWRDNEEDEAIKFEMGEDGSKVAGTPDLLLRLEDGTVVISDAKTSMAKSFGYVPVKSPDIWEDFLWFKYKLQVETYYMLCHKNREWFEKNGLPLPEKCHLFSYALDDGVNRREFIWSPSQETASKILYYVERWNKAFASETMPDCECDETQTKFCYYVTQQEPTRTGYKLGVRCCDDSLEPKK